jgi:hypothetical protein
MRDYLPDVLGTRNPDASSVLGSACVGLEATNGNLDKWSFQVMRTRWQGYNVGLDSLS